MLRMADFQLKKQFVMSIIMSRKTSKLNAEMEKENEMTSINPKTLIQINLYETTAQMIMHYITQNA